jgi:hypothetical protein
MRHFAKRQRTDGETGEVPSPEGMSHELVMLLITKFSWWLSDDVFAEILLRHGRIKIYPLG